jgi:hypothetical protein
VRRRIPEISAKNVRVRVFATGTKKPVVERDDVDDVDDVDDFASLKFQS